MTERTLTRRGFAAASAAFLSAGSALGAEPDIHLRVVGSGERTWVLLHPFSASGKLWEARAASLAEKHGVTVLSPDLPSHGRSRIVDEWSYVDAGWAVHAALGDRPAPEVVVGASSGGIVALRLAAIYRCPVLAIGVGDAFSHANLETMRAFSQAPDTGNDAFATAYREQGEAQRLAIRKHLGQLANSGTGPFLNPGETSNIGSKTVILNGSKDDFFSQAQAHALADSIPGSALTFLTGAGHLDPLAGPWRDHTWSTVEALAARHRG